MGTRFAQLHFLLLVTVASPLFAAGPDLSGDWVGSGEFNGQQGEFVLHIEETDAGVLTAAVSMPPIEAWRVPMGQLRVDGNTVSLGPVAYTYDPDAETLSGNLPFWFVPVHEIPVVMRRDRQLPEPVPRPDYGRSARPAWTFDTGGPVYASPRVSAGVVFVGSDDGHLYALSADDGEPVWKTRTGGKIRARPTIDGDFIYIPSDDGHLYKLAKQSGEVIWRIAIGADPAPRSVPGQQDARYDHFASSATVAGDRLLIGTLDGQVLAVATDNGRVMWRFETGGAVQSTPVIAANRAIFGAFDNLVYALDPKTGELMWKRDTGAPVASSPAVWNDLVIIGSRSYDLLALDINNGDERWRDYYWFSWIESTASVAGDRVFVGSSDAGYLLALDADSGQRLWVFDTAGSAWGQPAVGEHAVYIGSVGVAGYIADHRPGFYAVDRESGRALWSFLPERPEAPGNSGFASSPAIGDGRVFVGGIDGRIYAFDKTGGDR